MELATLRKNRSSLSEHIRSLYDYKPLPLEEEEKLAGMIAAGDRAALDRLVRHNLRFVISVVKATPAWHRGDVPEEDLVAMGNEALLKAASRWQPKNNARFATYAKPFIIKGVRRAIDNEWSLVRLPVNIQEEIRKIKYAERCLMQEVGYDPTNEQIADRVKMHPERVAELQSLASRSVVSLDSSAPEKFHEEEDE